jgi:curved DNA-binding protein CbpA
MVFSELKNLYEVLDLKPEASAAEIRNAYIRAKNAFQKDSAALYSLLGDSEREEILAKVEHAYRVLSDINSRKEYDRSFENLHNENLNLLNVISIDRTPPMEMSSDDELLTPPTTDSPGGDFFSNAVASKPEAPIPAALGQPPASIAPPAASPAYHASPASPISPPTASAPAASAQSHAHTQAHEPAPAAAASHPQHPTPPGVEQEILEQTEWSGTFLRRVRESKTLSYEEITRETRVPKNYIIAIEEEDVEKLPAPVYIRGFVTQLARILKLPVNTVVQTYMSRIRDSYPEKFR